MLDIKLKFKPGHTTERDWMEPSSIKTLFWNITYACNCRCTICFTDSAQSRKDELSPKEALSTVDMAYRAGIKDIIISGGEPFMRGDLIPILSQMARYGITARIASNGTLLSDDILRKVKAETLTKSFQISLDTIDPDLYAEVHNVKRDVFPRVLQSIRLIQKHGFHTTVSARLTPLTLPGIPLLLEKAEAEGWSTVTIHFPVHTKRVNGVFPPDEDLLDHMGDVFDRFLSLPGCWLVESYIPWTIYHPVMKRLEKKVRVVHRGCRAGRDRLTINPTGSLSPCVCMDLPEAYVGNVRQDDLKEVFENSRLCRMLRNPAAYGICSDCPNIARCGGGCRATAYVLSGRFDGPDKSCPVWKKRLG